MKYAVAPDVGNLMRALIVVVAVAVGLPAVARDRIVGDGRPATEAREVASFDGVRLESAADVTVHVGAPLKVTVTADGNLLPHVKTDVRSGVLVIDSDQDLRPKTPLRVEISIPLLRQLRIDGSGDVRVDGGRGDAELAIAGSGDIDWKGDAGKLRATISGAGDVTLRGSAAQLGIEVAGSGSVDAGALKARDIDVKVSGSGDVRVHLDGGRLRADVSGSGDVEWSGSGTVERARSSGSGQVHRS